MINIEIKSVETESKRKNRIGIVLMITASFFLALAAVMFKSVRHIPLMEVVFFRSIPSMIVLPVILKIRKIPLSGNHHKLLFFRCLLGIIGVITYLYTCMEMSIADAVSIKQIGAIIIVIFSVFLLKEKVKPSQIFIFILGFIGTLFIIKPGLRIEMLPAYAGLIGAVSGAGAHVILRKLRLTDHPLVIVNYFAYASGITALIILLLQGGIVTPDPFSLLLLILIGINSLVIQTLLTLSYRYAPASVVAVYRYTHIMFGVLFGLIFFKEIPDIFSMIGSITIILCGYLIYKTRA